MNGNITFLKFILFLTFSIRNNECVCKYNVIERGFSEAEKAEIVKIHNDLRLLIACGRINNQPKGKHMKEIKYSSYLAQEAQATADTCEYKHKKANGTQFSSVGQNLYLGRNQKMVKGPDIERALKKWFDEYKIYKYGKNYQRSAGHYTQEVWDTTEFVGCGYVHFIVPNDGYKYHKLIACNYGPGGNVRGRTPYAADYARSGKCELT